MRQAADSNAHTAQTEGPSKPLPWWGLLLLVPGLAISVFAGMMIGVDCLASAYWGNGIVWGMWIALSLGGVFWLSRLSSPQWAFMIIVGYFFVVGVGAQINYWDLAQDRVFRSVQDDKEDSYPLEWKSIAKDDLYQVWMTDVLQEPPPHGWWSHLRAQALAGISNYERAAEFEPGKSGYRAVHRDSFWVWFAWFCQYVFVVIACVISIAGCAVWDVRVRQEEQDQQFSQRVLDQVADALEERGVQRSTTQRIIQDSCKQKPIDMPINHKHVADLMPGLPDALIQDISLDLEYNRQWRSHWDPVRTFDTKILPIVEEIILRFYNGDERLINASSSWMYLLIAAWRLEQHQSYDNFYTALKQLYDVVLALGHGDQVKPFRSISLDGIAFKRIEVGEEWASLAVREANFYARDSVWDRLVALEPEQIPEQAYPGILYQYYFTPDRRAYEFWAGTEPSDLVQALGPRLRDAVLTFIEREQQAFADTHGSLDHLLSVLGTWPYEIAAPLLARAMESGWRGSLSQIPETDEWEHFLDSYEHSVFGSPRNYVKWYDHKKYRMERAVRK